MKRITLLLFTVCIVLLSDAAVTKNLTGLTAGGLKAALTPEELITITDLVISGSMDATDFRTMRDDMLMLENIDLSGTSIVSYSGTEGTYASNSSYEADAIPYYAFRNPSTGASKTDLKSFVFPTSINTIQVSAFESCVGLNTITIPASVSHIGNKAFYACSGINSVIVIPQSVQTMGKSVFALVPGNISVDNLNPNFSSEDGVLFNKLKTELIHCPMSKSGAYVIPSTVEVISENAFVNCIALTGDLDIPTSVKTIEYGAFCYCSGYNGVLNIPSTVTSIGADAFSSCSGLVGTLTLPDGITSIENGTFYNCSSLSGDLTIPPSVKSIGTRAFEYCSSLDGTLTFSTSLLSINEGAFSYCSALSGDLIFPESLTSIGVHAFSECTGLNGSIIIPSSVTSIGNYAFNRCQSVTSIYANNPTPLIFDPTAGIFIGMDYNNCTLYVPSGSINQYSKAELWKDFFVTANPATYLSKQTNSVIAIYPNPTIESFRIEGINESALLILSDIQGRVLINKVVLKDEEIDVNKLPNGVYTASIILEGVTTTQKLMKK